MTHDTHLREPTITLRRLVIVLSMALLAYNGTIHLVPGFNALYVPLNAVAAAVLWLVALRAGLTRSDLGLDPTRARAGLTWGASVAALAALGLALAVAVPSLHFLLDDARMAGIGPGLLAYRSLIRIPLGTALFEEFAFRGVLFGAWSRMAAPARAAVGSSLVFGLWHVRPTIDVLDANALALSAVTRTTTVAAAVLLTATAGYVFCLLRIRSRSLLAPFIAHASINSLALVAAYAVARWLPT